MKNGAHRPPKWNWRSTNSSNSIAIVSWVTLILMFSAVFVSILWETYTQTSKEDASSARNETYVYPTFVLDFADKLRQRKIYQDYYGYSLESDGTVERRSDLSLEEFWDLYDTKWPVIITDVVPKWPAFEKWSKEYLNSTYGNERVVMKAVKGALKDAEGLSLPLHLFVNHSSDSSGNHWTYLTDELFITQRPELRADVPSTIYTQEDFFQQFPGEIRPWDCMLLWGTTHSRSMLHIDPYNWTGTNAVLWGTKKWKLFPPGQDHLLYTAPDAICGFPLECNKYNSPLDAFAPEAELQKYPLYRTAHSLEFEQKAGELLIIPSGWFHQAYNVEETLAVSGQMMNRNNYRYILEEILKAGNLQRAKLPDGFHNLLPPDQVNIFMSLLPKKILQKGKALTENYLKDIHNGTGHK